MTRLSGVLMFVLSSMISAVAARPALAVPQLPTTFYARLELRIDGYEANLVPVQWLGIAPDGTIALIQRLDNNIRFFDADGEPLGIFGRDGEGPGEFSGNLYRGGWIGDTLWVFDAGLRRFTLISPDRKLLGTMRYAGAEPAPEDADRYPRYPVLAALPQAVRGDGSLLVTGVLDAHNSVYRVSDDGTIEALILRVGPPLTGKREAVSIPVNEGRGIYFTGVPFAPPRLLVVSPNGRRVAAVTIGTKEDAPTFRVTLVDARGDTIYSRAYPFTPMPITQQDVDSVMATVADGVTARRAGAFREIMDEVRSEIPSHRPPVIDAFIGTDGQVWLAMQPTAVGRPWLILDATGDVVGTVTVPARVFLKAAGGMRAWGLERDEFDVESVVRYRLVPTS